MTKHINILGIHFGLRYKWEAFQGVVRTGVDAGRISVDWHHDETVLCLTWDVLGPSVSIGKVNPDWAGGKVIGPFYFTRGI